MTSPWRALEAIPGLIALPVTWRARTGEDFEKMRFLCLKTSQWIPRSYVLPGDTPSAGQTPLPPDIEQAAVEQAAAWFLRRDMLGLDTSWPKGGILQRFSKLDLLLPVQQVLARYRRWTM